MEIEDTFRVNVPVEDAWRILLDIERIAPCLPGAQLQEIAGEEYRGVVKVKVGPITAAYKGVAKFEERNDETHTAVIVGNGRDTRGQGNASATITMTLTPDDTGTTVSVATDLSITGKVAQFGRGVMADVSAKLLAQFVANLERDVLSAPAVDLTAPEPAAPGTTADSPSPDSLRVSGSGSPSANGSANGEGAETRRIDQPEVEPVNLLEMGGSPVLKRLLPVVGAGILLFVVLRVLRGLRARRSAR